MRKLPPVPRLDKTNIMLYNSCRRIIIESPPVLKFEIALTILLLDSHKTCTNRFCTAVVSIILIDNLEGLQRSIPWEQMVLKRCCRQKVKNGKVSKSSCFSWTAPNSQWLRRWWSLHIWPLSTLKLPNFQAVKGEKS